MIGFVFKSVLAVGVLAGTIGVVMAAVGQGHGSGLAREAAKTLPDVVVTPVGKGLDVAGSGAFSSAAQRVREWSGNALEGGKQFVRSARDRGADVGDAARRAADHGKALLHPPLDDPDGASVGASAFVEPGE